ncbi:coiled-coil-helix-coiled-coil-helix domain-containing protein 6B, mitochondrial-like, partial [Scleropages formosus]
MKSLSEDVLQRMRDRAGSPGAQAPPPESHREGPGTQPGPTAAELREELRRRYEREHALVQEELARIARQEREAGREELSAAVRRERAQAREDAEKARQLVSHVQHQDGGRGINPLREPEKEGGLHAPADLDAWVAEIKLSIPCCFAISGCYGCGCESSKHILGLAKQLDKKEAELKRLAVFYKEQLTLLEKKNLEYYKLASEQYQEAAAKAEAHIKSRSTTPVCADLQAQILNCYRENQGQTLCCSSLAKEYMQCIDAAKKKDEFHMRGAQWCSGFGRGLLS